jgi:hypothetical protein
VALDIASRLFAPSLGYVVMPAART